MYQLYYDTAQFLSAKSIESIAFAIHLRFFNKLSSMPQNTYAEIDTKLCCLIEHFDFLQEHCKTSKILQEYAIRHKKREQGIFDELTLLRQTSDDGQQFSSAAKLDQYLDERNKVSECINSLPKIKSDLEKQKLLTKLKGEIKSPTNLDVVNRYLQEVNNNIQIIADADQKIEEAKDLLQIEQYAEGVKILEMLANRGYIAAQLALGHFYQPKIEVGVALEESNCMKAIFWLKKAAESGSIEACDRLCTLYFWLPMTDENEKKVFEWRNKAVQLAVEKATIGDVDAYHWLGNAYFLGRGVKKDISKAIEWFQKGVEIGDPVTQHDLAKLYFKIGDEEKDKAKLKAAFELATKASEQGNVSALVTMGIMYDTGKGVPKDYKKAMALFKQAADLGDSQGKWQLEHRKRFWE